MIGKFERRDAAADAEFEAAAADLIEHADFLHEPQRIVKRQQIDQRPHMDSPGACGDRGEKNAGRRREAERRRVMFGDVVAEKTGGVGGRDQLEALLVYAIERLVATLEMVEDAECDVAHAAALQCRSGRCSRDRT